MEKGYEEYSAEPRAPEIPIYAQPDVDLTEFIDLPNRKTALRAQDESNNAVFLAHGIAKKLYRCLCCTDNIEIGTEHTILSRIQMSRAYTHHHIDTNCTQEVILPTLHDIQKISASEASETALNALRRKYRYKHR